MPLMYPLEIDMAVSVPFFSHYGPSYYQAYEKTFLFGMSNYGREHVGFFLVCMPSIGMLFLESGQIAHPSVHPSVNTAAAQNPQALDLLKTSRAPKERNESQEPSNMRLPHTCFI